MTGRPPYQFVKEGYGRVSHFISEFRARFGVTPRTYSDAHSLSRELRTQGDDQVAAPHELAEAPVS